MVDASLCGMGRGAGNTTTELLTSFLNRKHHKNYNLDEVLDAIDTYMVSFQENISGVILRNILLQGHIVAM